MIQTDPTAQNTTPSDTAEFDVAIIGGGPAGSALAILLARLAPQAERVILFQAEQTSRYDLTVANDTRVIAVNEGSRVLLHDLDAWPNGVAPIETIHVSQKGRLGRTLIRHEDFGVPALGHVLRYAQLHETLLSAAMASGVTVVTGHAAHAQAHGDHVCVTAGQHDIQAKLAVRADGMNHQPGDEMPTQMALLGLAEVSQPRAGWAYERFTREGPFAVLPHPDQNGAQSIVWCCTPEHAQQLVKMPTDAFSEAMQATFGDRLGSFKALTSFKAYPLYKSISPEPVQGRVVNVGNAAQTLHPVAGQGLNLALRDVATLAHCLRDWMASPIRDPGRSLGIYEKLRQPDRNVTVGLTNLLSSVFVTKQPIVEHGAGLALLALDTLPALRAPLARHLMQGLRS
jgi:2-octaprenyl-6-methoxyphenol hydroxylase